MMQLIPKSKTHAIRFALILETLTSVMEGRELTSISNNSMVNAIRLAEYYVRQQLKVTHFIESTEVEKLPPIKQTWYHALGDLFSRADAHKLLTNRFDVSKTEVDKFIQRGVKKTKIFKRIGQGQYQKLVE